MHCYCERCWPFPCSALLMIILWYMILQVNADVRYYIVNSDNTLTLVDVDTAHVGKSISTKAIGSSDRHDVTDQYKFEEGSASERAALQCK